MIQLCPPSYHIIYDENELYGIEDHIFDFNKPNPIMYFEFLKSDELNWAYLQLLSSFGNNQRAKVHKVIDNKLIDNIGVYDDLRSTDAIICPHELYTFLEDKLQERCYPIWRNNHELIGEFKRRQPWTVLGYKAGDFFKQHCDSMIRIKNMTTEPKNMVSNQIWYPNNPVRKFTTLLYFNDYQEGTIARPGTYTGGELTFNRIRVDKNNPQNRLTFKPKAGWALTFPSNFVFSHEVKMITSGYRFSAATWTDFDYA